MYRNINLLLCWALLLPYCINAQQPGMVPVAHKDSHTLSNAGAIKIKHLYLDVAVDPSKKEISGAATWHINNETNQKELILDSHELTIDSVKADRQSVRYFLDQPIPHVGQALHISLVPGNKQITVFYRTSPSARALQWLEPQQTNDKKYPFLYTQSESIYARSWIPCPDGPGIRFTYSARIKVPRDLMALMSADNPNKKNDSGIYHFNMNIPVPAYLMALAVGDITFKKIDDRTGVYSEPGMIEKVRKEFDEVGKMVYTAEQLYGKYAWGRYDVLVLPPGFPIGGMENPKLTFCTPTVIAGDRSLVSLIAHELAHSWSGNLVTNATWNDFWLNEGFTVYFERRIMEKLKGKAYADMLWELGFQDLAVSVEDIGKTSNDTWLKLSLEGRDPDDGLTDIPYEKGSHFLKLLEKRVGRQNFDKFLVNYFNSHAFKTITTEEFLVYLDKNLVKGNSKILSQKDINEWVYGPGIPANCPRAGMERFGKVDAERAKYLNGATAKNLTTSGWSTHEWLHFLRKMPESITTKQMKELDDAFNFTATGNSEIADLWFIWAVRTGYTDAYGNMEKFLNSVGRRKFLEPLYGEMMKTPDNTVMARKLYNLYKNNYHPLAQERLNELMKGKK